MDKIKRYIEMYIPVETCNLRCHYCYITVHKKYSEGVPQKLKYSPHHVRAALSVERLGGVCLINMCALGETLLLPSITQYIKELLEEGHYISLVTNGTISKRFDEIVQLPKALLSHLFFKFSYHFLEFKEKHLFDMFFDNIRKVRDAGASFSLELTPSDEAIPFINEIKEVAVKNLGALPHITIARDESKRIENLPKLTRLTDKEYYNTWEQFQSPLFSFKKEIFEQRRKEFCYAGDWSFWLHLGTGEMHQCYMSYYSFNIFDDIKKPIKFYAVGCHCQEPHCFNGHSFLTLGVIPTMKTPMLAQMRNRVCVDGSEWLQPQMKGFLSSKLVESNCTYSLYRKIRTSFRIYYLLFKRKAKDIYFKYYHKFR